MRISRLALASVVAAAAFALLAGAPAAAAPLQGLTVTGPVSYEYTALAVEGAITVESGGELTLDGVDLTVTSGASTPASLIVRPGGSLVVRDSTLRSDAAGFRFEIRGSADLQRTLVLSVASDPAVPVGRELAAGQRIASGGLLIASDDVRFQSVGVRGAVGCGVTIDGASPVLKQIDISAVAYRVSGPDGYAAALCVVGGSPRIEGISVDAIGFEAAGAPSRLFAAGILADTPRNLYLSSLDLTAFAPSLNGRPAPASAAVVVRDPAFLTISGGRIKGTTTGIVLEGSSAPATGGATTIEALTIDVVSGPVTNVGVFNGDPQVNWSDLQITGCGAVNGLLFQSNAGGSAASVTVNIHNVTANSCGQAGVQLYNNAAAGTHNFNVWDTNASQNGWQGYWIHGISMLSGMNVQMANNRAIRNGYAGFHIEATYANTAPAKLASAKLENNLAVNNSLSSSSWNGGFILTLGTPTTMAMRYNNNVALGNTGPGSPSYGHYATVAVTQTFTVVGGTFNDLVSDDNGEYGAYLGGGTALVARLDVRLLRATIVNHTTVGLYGYYARIEVWQSSMENSKELDGNNAAFYLMGTVHTRLSGTTSGVYRIISYKQICIHGEWQNGAPLYLIPLTFTNGNNSAAAMYSDVSVDPPIAAGGRQTDANGNWSGWTLDWTYDPQAPSSQQYTDLAPLTISVQLFETSASVGPFDLHTNVCGPVQFVDPNPPDIIVNSPRENGTYTKSNLSVQGSVSDDLSGLAGLEISLDGANWTALTGPAGTFSYTFVDLADGTYDVHLRAWDRANEGLAPRNESHVILLYVTIDTIAPAIDITEPAGLQDGGQYFTANDTIFFRGTVDASVVTLYINGQPIAVAGVVFLHIGPLPNEGPQSFLFLAIDAAGNAKSIKITIFKDKVNPTLIITAPSARGDIYVSSHLLEVQGITDANVVVRVNGALSPLAGTAFGASVVLTEGRNVINVSAVDAAGNRAARTLIVYSDTVAPTVTLQSHQNGMYLNHSRQEFTGTISEAVALFEVNLRIFEVTSADFAAVLGLAEGQNLISINATDRAGNIGRAVVTVTVDTVSPEILVIGLPDFLTRNSANLNIRGSVSEDAAVTVEGDAVDVLDLQFDTSVTLREGENILEFRATDAAGNSALLVRHVTLDVTQPTIAITDPSPGETVHSRTVQIVGTSEPHAVVQIGEQRVVADATGRFTAWVELASDGQQSISITVTDAAGNSFQESFPVEYQAAIQDTSGDMVTGIALLAILGGALAVVSMFLAKKRVGGEVDEARRAAQEQMAMQEQTPGYTEAPQEHPMYAPQPPAEPSYYAEPQAPEGGYGEPAPEPAPAAPPPRPPRPPRAPTN